MAAPVIYEPGFIADPNTAYTALWNDLAWERRPGAPRREYWTNTLGRDYTYGRGVGQRTYVSNMSHPVIEATNAALIERLGHGFEGCFLNGYEGQHDSLDWHADDDPAIDHNRPIAVVTIGAGRAIQFKPMDGSEPRSEVFLEPGSLLLMLPGMQSTHKHRIPKVGHKVMPRISLTFRGLRV